MPSFAIIFSSKRSSYTSIQSERDKTMKENIILSIASLNVPMSDLKADLKVAKEKFHYNSYSFSWATVVALLNEIVDKEKVLSIAGLSVSISEIVADVEAAKKKYHYNDLCFCWTTVEALCDVVESQYTFNGLYFFYNEEGVKQVQKSKSLSNGDWFAVEDINQTYKIFKKENGILKSLNRLLDFEIPYFARSVSAI